MRVFALVWTVGVPPLGLDGAAMLPAAPLPDVPVAAGAGGVFISTRSVVCASGPASEPFTVTRLFRYGCRSTPVPAASVYDVVCAVVPGAPESSITVSV